MWVYRRSSPPTRRGPRSGPGSSAPAPARLLPAGGGPEHCSPPASPAPNSDSAPSPAPITSPAHRPGRRGAQGRVWGAWRPVGGGLAPLWGSCGSAGLGAPSQALLRADFGAPHRPRQRAWARPDFGRSQPGCFWVLGNKFQQTRVRTRGEFNPEPPKSCFYFIIRCHAPVTVKNSHLLQNY